jgi:hypothetical protein
MDGMKFVVLHKNAFFSGIMPKAKQLLAFSAN